MLVVCNGAFRSGSTWLFRMIRVILKGNSVPTEYQADERWHGASISAEELPNFLENVDFHNEDYVCKSHYNDIGIRDMLLKHSDVYILNIKRDLRDVIVSSYFHYKRVNEITQTFEEYYWDKGRTLIKYLNHYHNIWHNIDGRIYVSSYQRLHNSFNEEAKRIFRFLNRNLTPEEIRILKAKTSLQASRKLWDEESLPVEKRFFRKGIIGDWRNYFSAEILKDFDETNLKTRDPQMNPHTPP